MGLLVYELVRLQVHVSANSLVHGEEDFGEEENDCIRELLPENRKKRKANGGYLHSSSSSSSSLPSPPPLCPALHQHQHQHQE
jgi:hypothetical protein